MDGNEAIQIVKEAFSAYESDYRCIGENAKWDNIHEALDLAIEALKEPKPVEDAISRADTIRAMCAKCVINRECIGECSDVVVIKNMPPVQPKPVKDAISKHDLWRIIEDNAYWVTYNETSHEKGMTLTGINQALNECPPVEPERPKGEWVDYTEYGYVECPFCHSATNCDGNKDELHFCFSCGADMRGEEDV